MLKTALPKILLDSTLLTAGVAALSLRQDVIYLGSVTALSFLDEDGECVSRAVKERVNKMWRTRSRTP